MIIAGRLSDIRKMDRIRVKDNVMAEGGSLPHCKLSTLGLEPSTNR
jgi:hypothetical protein